MEASVPQTGGGKDVPVDDTKKEASKKGQKTRKRKSKRGQDLSCPMKILDSVLSTASYKVPNLSQEVERKFYHTADYSKELAGLLADVVYLPTVGEVNEYQSDVPISVFPFDFEGEVEVHPSAMMSLSCINQAHKKRVKWKGAKGNKGKARKDVKTNEKDAVEVNIVNEEKELDPGRTTIKDTETTVTVAEHFNGQQVSMEAVAGNETNETKKKRKNRRKKKNQQQQGVDENGGNVKTNGDV